MASEFSLRRQSQSPIHSVHIKNEDTTRASPLANASNLTLVSPVVALTYFSSSVVVTRSWERRPSAFVDDVISSVFCVCYCSANPSLGLKKLSSPLFVF